MIGFSSILADVITADMGFLPGLALVGPAFGLPLSLLAGVLERPFYSRAGISRWAIWYSLQANLISLLVGYLLLPIAIFAFAGVGPLWMPVSVFISIAVERAYLKRRARSAGFDFGWRWVSSWGNVFSAFALVGVLLMAGPFDTPRNKTLLFPYFSTLTGVGFGISLLAFTIAFIIPAAGTRRAKARDAHLQV
jgi:hypothetical protein